jgi:hypothetical protein
MRRMGDLNSMQHSGWVRSAGSGCEHFDHQIGMNRSDRAGVDISDL